MEDLGFTALKRKDFQEAINIFRRSLESRHTARAYYGLAQAYHLLGEEAIARWAVYQALEIDSALVEAQRLADSLTPPTGIPSQHQPPVVQTNFRALSRYFEIRDKRGDWKPLFIKGINLGLGLPGYFPGEYPIAYGTYLGWFAKMHELGVNTVRIYTVHPPSFYKALYEINAQGKPLYLMQGIWTEPPPQDDFNDPAFLASWLGEIEEGVHIIHGRTERPERPGYAHGHYTTDVSSFTIGFMLGREWESCPVRKFNEKNGNTISDFSGEFLTVRSGSPFEIWVARICDHLQSYEQRQYGVNRPVSMVNWATLDPLTHPSESTYEENLHVQGIDLPPSAGCQESEDIVSLDTARIVTKEGSGFFTTYHVYPYYPDFINNDYADQSNVYQAYLEALARHHGQQPVIIAEFGVPSSREVAHWQRNGWHQGGHDEVKQGDINGSLLRIIHKTGLAGAALFSWFDEWFKRNWLFIDYERPPERKVHWFNHQDPEENYGLLAMYPGYPDKIVSLSGSTVEWLSATALYKNHDSQLYVLNDGHDRMRHLTRMAVQHDEGFLYLLLETGGTIDFRHVNYLIGIDTCEPQTGEFAFPFGIKTRSPVGLKFIIHLVGEKRSRMLASASYDKYLNGGHDGVIHPVEAAGNGWVVMMNRTNSRRISKDGSRFYLTRVFSMSTLRHGTLKKGDPRCTSLADFFVSDRNIEIRIPWGLMNVTDPSSKTVLWKTKDRQTRLTDGISLVAVSYAPSGQGQMARRTPAGNLCDTLPHPFDTGQVHRYEWPNWDTPLFHAYPKESFDIFRRYLHEVSDELV